jgi:hypothetical protein
MLHCRRPGRYALLVALVGLALAAVATPAEAVSGSVQLLPQAGLHAKGAGVTLQLTLTCPKGDIYSVGSTVTQRLSETTSATGSGPSGANGTCSGSPQALRDGLLAGDPTGTNTALPNPFVLGAAFASTRVTICDANQTCLTRKAARTVQVQAVILNKSFSNNSSLSTSIPPQGKIEARGAGAVIVLPYRCSKGLTGSLSLVLGQRTSRGVMTSSDDTGTLDCDATGKTGVVAFHAPRPFWQAGSAFAVLNGFLCDGNGNCNVQAFAFRSLNLTSPAT